VKKSGITTTSLMKALAAKLAGACIGSQVNGVPLERQKKTIT
jgi:hypothetical protein